MLSFGDAMCRRRCFERSSWRSRFAGWDGFALARASFRREWVAVDATGGFETLAAAARSSARLPPILASIP